jgi:hypothetical protein
MDWIKWMIIVDMLMDNERLMEYGICGINEWNGWIYIDNERLMEYGLDKVDDYSGYKDG